jgi:hypothetical protein
MQSYLVTFQKDLSQGCNNSFSNAAWDVTVGQSISSATLKEKLKIMFLSGVYILIKREVFSLQLADQ